MSTTPLTVKKTIEARALLIGERIDLRSLSTRTRLASDPLVVPVEHGMAVLFRYGAVVFFNVSRNGEETFLRSLVPWITRPYDNPETETLPIAIDSHHREGIEGDTLYLKDDQIERFQIVADILGKSTVLALYEAKVAQNFDRIEPFAVDLDRKARSGRNARELLRHIGGALLSEHTMVARVEVGDKPELVWERPDLERLYLRLEDEFEILERHRALERKLDLIARTAETALEVLQDRRNLRVEWYIVILIVLEILLTLYSMFFPALKQWVVGGG